MKLKGVLLFALTWCFHTSALAAPADPQAVPAVLAPWIPWVLEGTGEAKCVTTGEVKSCVFLTSLSLTADATGATFTLTGSADAKARMRLPGSSEHWPLDVLVDGRPAVVLEPDAVPQVHVPPGTHVVQGRLRWNGVPDSIQIPPQVAVVQLNVSGRRVERPRREASGLLWLAAEQRAQSEAERLELSVQRRIDDGIPLKITTRIQVSAAGNAREVVLPRVLVEGTRPIELTAELPAQLSPDGGLRMQVQAGTYRIEVVAISERDLPKLSAPSHEPPWPSRETWVFAADDVLRHVELSGGSPVDVSRTDLASDWHGLPAFVVTPGTALTLTTRRRGEPEPAPNELSLTRRLMLDLDGRGYTVEDSFSGTMHRDFRIDLAAGALGHVKVHGRDELITLHDNRAGVELRRGDVQLAAEWRLEDATRELPAVGWSEDVKSLSTSLSLPPGYLLLAAEGVDRTPGTWLSQWDLWDFFFVLLVSLAVGKLAGAPWAIVALLTLVLTHHEPEAPTTAWLFLLTATALVRVIRPSRWASVARAGFLACVVGLLIVAVPFAVSQLRKTVYPHLDRSAEGGATFPTQYADVMVSPEPARAPSAAREEVASEEAYGGAASSVEDAPRRKATLLLGSTKRSAANEVDPQAVVQTGPGMPSWSFRTHELMWSGPVQRDQQVKLWLVPPLGTRIWSALTVLLTFALLFALARAAKASAPGSLPPPALALLMLALGTLAPTLVSAQAAAPTVIPPAEMLAELKQRLLAPADCEPHCLSVQSLAITVRENQLTLRAEVHAGAAAAYRAPGPVDTFAPDRILLDGTPALAATRLDDGFIHVRVPEGKHVVELGGSMPSSQTLTLALGAPPHRVTVDANDFTIEGLRADGRAEGSIQLRRKVVVDPALGSAQQTLMPWLNVTRRFDLGVTFRVTTTLQRLGPATESMIVSLPMLEGESVTEAGLTSEDGSVVIELPRDKRELSFQSTLSPRNGLTLVAALPEDAQGDITHPFSETWQVSCAALYHCTLEGIAPVSRLANGIVEPTFKPFPGETLQISITRLEAARGASTTIDRAELVVTPGKRIEEGVLTLDVRTSRGSTERLALPTDATLSAVNIDGKARPSRIKDGKLELPLDPGSHSVEVRFRRNSGIAQRYTTPAIRVERPLTNVKTFVELPSDRWLLWASGPSWGPAILFWGYLLMVLLSAVALGGVEASPLRSYEWALLGLGLTQVEAPIVLIVVGYLFALSFRERREPAETPWVFNLAQVGLVLFTLVALACLAYAVRQGLVVRPDMQVEGLSSTDSRLEWYVDRTSGAIPRASVFSVPLWIYKGIMLAWALWLAMSLLKWLRWGFQAFRKGGTWKTSPRRTNPKVPMERIAEARAELAGQTTKDDAGDP